MKSNSDIIKNSLEKGRDKAIKKVLKNNNKTSKYKTGNEINDLNVNNKAKIKK